MNVTRLFTHSQAEAQFGAQYHGKPTGCQRDTKEMHTNDILQHGRDLWGMKALDKIENVS